MSKKVLIQKMSKIKELEREVKKEKRKALVECSHQNEKGKLKIHPINEKGDYECKICNEKFNMSALTRASIEDAVETIHNAIQQIRCFSDPEDDAKLIKILGELDFNLQETSELYDRVVNLLGKNKNKNKNNRYKDKDKDKDSFGSYGSSALSFIGGGKRK